jgi:hypothetical protein
MAEHHGGESMVEQTNSSHGSHEAKKGREERKRETEKGKMDWNLKCPFKGTPQITCLSSIILQILKVLPPPNSTTDWCLNL